MSELIEQSFELTYSAMNARPYERAFTAPNILSMAWRCGFILKHVVTSQTIMSIL
jgi:hypothetical protein